MQAKRPYGSSEELRILERKRNENWIDGLQGGDARGASHAGKREGQADGTDGEPGRVYENGGDNGGVAFAGGGTERRERASERGERTAETESSGERHETHGTGETVGGRGQEVVAGRGAEGAAHVCQRLETQDAGQARCGEGDDNGTGKRYQSDIPGGYDCNAGEPRRRTGGAENGERGWQLQRHSRQWKC